MPKTISKDKQTQDKLIAFGAEDLTDEELLTFILGKTRGSSGSDADKNARKLLAEFGSLTELAKASFSELVDLSEINVSRAARLSASVELGRRMIAVHPVRDTQLKDSQSIYNLYAPKLQFKNQELCYAALTDSKLNWIREIKLAEGSLFECVLRPSEAFAKIIKASPYGVVFIHNHPSGDPRPSVEDRELTTRLVNSGKLLGVKVLDHVIIGRGCYYSFADNGRLECEEDSDIWDNKQDDKKQYTTQNKKLYGTASDVLIFPDPPLPSPFDEDPTK